MLLELFSSTPVALFAPNLTVAPARTGFAEVNAGLGLLDAKVAHAIHLAALEVARLVLKHFQFPVEIPRLAHHVLQQC